MISLVKEKEVWKKIPGMPKRIEASSRGRIRTAAHYSKDGRLFKPRVYKQTRACHDYRIVRINGKNYFAHRLIGLAFHKNSNNLPEINHINGAKYNNRPDNLEWCTRSQNKQHAWDTGLRKLTPKILAALNSNYKESKERSDNIYV